MSIMHNGEKVLNNLTTVPITQTINTSSTETEIPSAKAIYNKSKNKTTDLPNGTDIIAYADSISNETVADTVRIMNSPNSPYGAAGSDFHYTIYNITDDGYKRIVAYDIRKNDMYMIMKHSGKWGKWQKVSATSVKDVPETDITTFTDSDVNGKVIYSVKNGICYVTLLGLYSTTAKSNIKVCGLPSATTKPHVPLLSATKETGQLGVGFLGADGIFTMHIFIANNGIYTSFSYPVAES